jgi:hypothetical protein
METYINNYLEENKVKLIYHRTAIYSYVSSSSAARYFTPVNQPFLSGPGYYYSKEGGVPFYAYTTNFPGTVPVYVYLRQGATQDFYYSLSNVPEISGPGYSYLR